LYTLPEKSECGLKDRFGANDIPDPGKSGEIKNLLDPGRYFSLGGNNQFAHIQFSI